MWQAQKGQCQQNHSGRQASAIHDHEGYNERRFEGKNPQPKMSQQEMRHPKATQQEGRDPEADDGRCESQEVWNHKWTESVQTAQWAAEERVEEVEMVEEVGMGRVVVEGEAQWR
jgi:hypothetical protein